MQARQQALKFPKALQPQPFSHGFASITTHCAGEGACGRLCWICLFFVAQSFAWGPVFPLQAEQQVACSPKAVQPHPFMHGQPCIDSVAACAGVATTYPGAPTVCDATGAGDETLSTLDLHKKPLNLFMMLSGRETINTINTTYPSF